MNRAASSSLTDVELVLFLVDGTMWTKDDEMVLNKLAKSGLRPEDIVPMVEQDSQPAPPGESGRLSRSESA